MKFRGLILTLFVFALGGPAQAERYENTNLFSRGAWSVDLKIDTSDSSMWCAASTTNKFGQVFSISGLENGSVGLHIIDPDWSLREREINFLVDIDYSRWDVAASADGIGLTTWMADADQAAKFMAELSAGNAVAVYNQTEQRLATFSLRGSKLAIAQFFKCFDRVADRNTARGVGRDPFKKGKKGTAKRSDPFK